MPGTTDTGNHGDDQTTTIALPFSYSVYDQTFNSVTVSSNGNAQFTTTDTAFTNECLPWATHDYAIFPYWDDQRTDVQRLRGYPGGTAASSPRFLALRQTGSSTSNGAPSISPTGNRGANYELRLYEGQTRFDVIYGTVASGNSSATGGVQQNDSAFDQYFCNGSGGATTGGQSYILQSCTPSPTPTASPSATATATPDCNSNGYGYSHT